MMCVPSLAFAAANFSDFVVIGLRLISNFIVIFMSALVLGILYGVFLYMANSDNEKRRESIKGYLVSAVIGLAVVVGMWGIIEIIQGSLFGGAFGLPRLSVPT